MKPHIEDLDPLIARNIIHTVGSTGTPPSYGYHVFTVGLECFLRSIEEEYLASFIGEGGSAFKMVVGPYGSGKTHFLYHVRDLAWQYDYAVVYLSLTQGRSPFYRLDEIYRGVAGELRSPGTAPDWSTAMPGLRTLLAAWYDEQRKAFTREGKSERAVQKALEDWVEALGNYENLNFQRAVGSALRALLNERMNDFVDICQWLSGQGYDRAVHGQYGITQKIDSASAWSLLRSLGRLVRQRGCRGLVILFDEAEAIPSLATRQISQHLGNLRECIDECGNTGFQHMLIMYAVPDLSFLEGRTAVYEALRQRLSTAFDVLNPSGVTIDLEKEILEPREYLCQVGERLTRIYAVAYGETIPSEESKRAIRALAEFAFEQRFGDVGYKRLFVQSLVRSLHVIRQEGKAPPPERMVPDRA